MRSTHSINASQLPVVKRWYWMNEPGQTWTNQTKTNEPDPYDENVTCHFWIHNGHKTSPTITPPELPEGATCWEVSAVGTVNLAIKNNWTTSNKAACYGCCALCDKITQHFMQPMSGQPATFKHCWNICMHGDAAGNELLLTSQSTPWWLSLIIKYRSTEYRNSPTKGRPLAANIAATMFSASLLQSKLCTRFLCQEPTASLSWWQGI
jgi:hypothetical protein